MLDWRLRKQGSREIIKHTETIKEIDPDILDNLVRDLDKYLSALDMLQGRVEAIEKRPPPVPLKPVNDPGLIPTALSDLHKRIEAIADENKNLNDASHELSVSALRALAEFSDSLEECRKQIGDLDKIWQRLPREMARIRESQESIA